MKEYIFDLSRIDSMSAWWDIYVQTVQGPGSNFFGRNQDAYRDSLGGGPGCPMIPCRFVFIKVREIGWEKLIDITRDELKKRMKSCHSSHIPNIEMQLSLLENGIGETILNWIIDPAIMQDGIEILIK